MNYHTNLKAWAVGEAINAKNAGINLGHSLEDLLAAAETIAEKAYKPESDFEDVLIRLQAILRCDPDSALEKIEQLQAELGVLHEQIAHQKAQAETVQ